MAAAVVLGVHTRAEPESNQDDVGAAKAGDLAAFERLYRASVARIFALALRLLGRSEAEEATQEAYLRAWRKLGTFRGDSDFTTWLYRLSLNSFLSRRGNLERESARTAELPGELMDELMDEPQQGSRAGSLRLDLEAAIARLPPGARAVFVLHDVEGLAHHEIGTRLSISVGTSKSQLHRARLLLRAALGPMEEPHG